ncbi:MAG: hypothetical protein KGI29_03420 [Pseudomonadota bacterium]|nr:hypothetical protein [Pseudomonadota bacterium]MDE3038761.1 hypothetical protein [Pseudomonadota bacterium]
MDSDEEELGDSDEDAEAEAEADEAEADGESGEETEAELELEGESGEEEICGQPQKATVVGFDRYETPSFSIAAITAGSDMVTSFFHQSGYP